MLGWGCRRLQLGTLKGHHGRRRVSSLGGDRVVGRAVRDSGE